MKLEDWLSDEGVSPIEFGRKIGVRRMTVHRYLKKGRVPCPAIMARIKVVTAGKVTADDFHSMLDTVRAG